MATRNITSEQRTGTGSFKQISVKGMTSLVVEFFGSASSATIDFKGVSFSGTPRSIAGVRMSDRVTANSGNLGEVWAFDISAWDYIAFSVTEVSGGGVGFKGRLSDGQTPITSGEYRKKVKGITITNGISIRDTSRKWLATQQDWSEYDNVVMRVDNGMDQPIKLTFNRQDYGDMYNLDGEPITVTIPANTTNILITPDQLPILGASIANKVAIAGEAETPPKSGSIAIVIYPKQL